MPVSALPGAELPVGPQLHLVVYASLVDIAYYWAVPPLLDIDADLVLHLARHTPSFATVTDVTDSNTSTPSYTSDDATTPRASAAATPGPATIGRAAAMHTDCCTAFDA